MTIVPVDFATPLCIAGGREGNVEDEETEKRRGRERGRGRDGRKWKDMDRERREIGEEKEDGAEEEEEWEGRRGANAECREAVGKWIIRKAQLKDNLYFINAAKLHYCSHTQSYCPHSRLRPGGGG